MGNREANRTIDESKAAVLLGLPLPDLRWFSRVLGLGQEEKCWDCHPHGIYV